MKVLFVCSGNICRSPMAAAYMRHAASQAGLSHVVVESAGTLDIHGCPASEDAVNTLARAGIDIRGHRSRGLRSADVRTSDIVIAMEHDHVDAVLQLRRAGDCRVYLLRAFESGPEPDGGAAELDDPIGGPAEFYRQQFDMIRRCIDHLVSHLRHGPT